MNLNNISIGKRLFTGFAILIFATSLIGLLAMMHIRAIAEISEKIYRHPLTVSSAVRDIRADIIAMHRSMKDVALAETDEMISEASERVSLYEKNVYKNFDIVMERFLGEKKTVQRALDSFRTWKTIRDEVIMLSMKGEKKAAAEITKGKGADHVTLMTVQIQEMIDFAGNKAGEFLAGAQKKEAFIQRMLFVSVFFLILFSICISYFITRSITSPLRLIVDRIAALSRGALSDELPFRSSDETGRLADSFRELQRNLQRTANAAEKIAMLDFSADTEPVGPEDELGKAFHAMSDSLKKSQKTLAESEKKYRNLFNSESDAILVLDVETMRIIEANKAAIALYGYSAEELLKMTAPQISAEPELTADVIKKEATSVPLRYHKKKDGTSFPVEITANYLTMDNRRINVTSIRDISKRLADEKEKKNIEELLHNAQKMEAIGTLAGGIAHDFNNLLGIITGNVSHAASLVKEGEELKDLLSDIEDGALKAKTLTLQLLTFAKGGDPIRKPADLNKLITETTGLVARGTKTIPTFELSEDLPAALVDEGQINQVLSNLIINAAQASPDGSSIIIKTDLIKIYENSVIPLSPGEYIKISVTDSGTGIPEENISKIFDPYFTTKQCGNGLGLTTSYSIINKHDGHLEVESEVDTGSTFRFYIPTHDGPLEKPATLHKTHTGTGKILVLDDEPAILKMADRILTKMGYEVVTASCGEDAIDIFQEAYNAQAPIKTAILDLTIPGKMGGQETIKELLKVDSDLEAYVSSGYSNDPVMANYNDYGFKGIIPKPYTKNEISEALARPSGE